jgi:hypothetical protein
VRKIRSFLPLCFLLCLSTYASALAAPTATEIEAVLRESSDIGKDRKFSVSSKESEVQIATYITAGSNDINNDCKIETVLIGRTIMAKYPDVSRVVVDFYNAAKPRTFLEIIVTKPEILAFGAGQVNNNELLSALRIEEKVDPKAAAAETQEKIEKGSKKEAHAEASKQLYKQALAKGENPEGKWITYHAPGIAFDYPGVWAINRELDGETQVSFRSTLTTYHTATMGLRLYRSPNKIPVETMARDHAARHMRYKNFQIIKKSELVRFGLRNSITGICENFSSTNEDGQKIERHIYFGWPGYTYKFYITANRDDYNHINKLFDHLLSTVRLESAPNTK